MALPSLEYRSVPLDQAEVWLAELESEGFTVVAAVAGDQGVLSHDTAQCQCVQLRNVQYYLATTLRSISVKV